jgi:hypothetical protein
MINNLVYPLDDENWTRFIDEIQREWPDISPLDLQNCKKNVNAVVGLIERCSDLSAADVIHRLNDIIKHYNIIYLDTVASSDENMYWDPSWKKYFKDTDYKLGKKSRLEYDDLYYTGSDH